MERIKFGFINIGKYEDRIATLERENADLKAQLAGLEMLIANLLAVIHRDGGQYQDKHGTGKACVDAQRVFTDTAAQLTEAERKRERLKSHIKESKRLIKMVEAREEYAWEKITELRESVDKQATEWEKRAVHYSIVWSIPAESAMECIYRKCASDLRAMLKEAP